MGDNIYRKILDALAQGEGVALRTELNGEEGTVSEDMVRTLAPIPLTKAQDGFDSIGPTLAQSEGRAILCEPVLPRERLIVLGGGHIALPLCEFAAKCGFCVTVADDRPAFANRERFPWAQEVLCDSFESAIARLNITPYDYVVIITRGHTHDADCLRAILPGQRPAYLGMIGSRRRVKGLLAMLAEEGYSQERIDQICTPIGLKIGAVTPEEIAVSILSELILYRRVPEKAAGYPRYVNSSDLDLELLDYLASNHEPKAIVTVMQTRGSTPRGAGAKMAVSPKGDITGSIGGGCSEGAVIRDAIDIIGTGAYKTMLIDMTGDVAESEGMVCGGTMLVLIEDGSER
ncbi:MAG: XdhC family protein [Clostridiales bacterium]|nr:XdhC family protein [Clostridiales bacterium]